MPAGSVPHKMTAKAGEGEAASREETESKAPPPSSLELLSCAAQQKQKSLTDASSINYVSVDASSVLPGVKK